MKKLILSLNFAAMCLFANAQVTNEQTAQNLPTATTEGFEFKFQGSTAVNCAPATLPGSNGIWNTFSTAGYSVDFTVGGTSVTPIIKASGTQGAGLFALRLPENNCGNYGNNPTDYIDCTSNPKIQMTVTSDVAVAKFSAMFGVLNAGFITVDGSSPTPNDPRQTVSLPANTPYTFTVTSPTHDYTGTVQPMHVIGLVFAIRDASDVGMAANISVTSIKIGDAVPTTATLAEVNNSLVSVYPNPAKDQISVDLSSLNTTDASVKIMNANGFVVYEAKAANTVESINTSSFNKGMYMVQVSAGNKVSNKKIVIE